MTRFLLRHGKPGMSQYSREMLVWTNILAELYITLLRACTYDRFFLMQQSRTLIYKCIDSPRQVRAIIVTKGEIQDLSERTLCNEFSSRIHLHMSYTYLTDLAHHKKLHRSRGTDFPYIPRWVIHVQSSILLMPSSFLTLWTRDYYNNLEHVSPAHHLPITQIDCKGFCNKLKGWSWPSIWISSHPINYSFPLKLRRNYIYLYIVTMVTVQGAISQRYLWVTE